MSLLVDLLLGAGTLGLPIWFAFLDRKAFPRLRWIPEGRETPTWGHAVVFIGVALAILVAFAAPISGFHPEH